MANHTHGVEKTSRANIERLADINGDMVTYTRVPEGSITVTQRHSSEPTIEAGGACSGIGGYGSGGTFSEITARYLEGLQVDGGLAWEVRYAIQMDTASV